MSRLQDVILRGTRAAQPVATAVPAGTIYFVTGENVLERSSGSTWESISAAVGGSVAGGVSSGFAISLLDNHEEFYPLDIPGPRGLQGLAGFGLMGPPGVDGEDGEPIMIPGLVGPQGPAGAGGAGPNLQIARVTLSEAQIEAWSSSPIDLVAAPGASKILIPVSFSIEINLTTAYSTSPVLSMTYAGDATNLLASTITITLTANLVKKFGFLSTVNLVSLQDYPTFSPVNKALRLKASADPGTPGTGVATGVVNVGYYVVTVS